MRFVGSDAREDGSTRVLRSHIFHVPYRCDAESKTMLISLVSKEEDTQVGGPAGEVADTGTDT